MRTSRVNITVPEDIVAQARAAGRADLGRRTGGGHGVVGSGGHTPNGADWAPASTERVTLILDSGGIGVLAGHRARLAGLRQRDLWPPQIPAVVLTEALTGDHRRDFHENQLVRMCQVRDVTEQLARDTALLRTRSGPATTISATDAVVAAMAVGVAEPMVLTGDPDDLTALVAEHQTTVIIAGV